jgi:hypothetical protein
MAASESYVRNRLYFVPLSDLQPDPNQPRKYLDPTALENGNGSRNAESGEPKTGKIWHENDRQCRKFINYII